MEEVVENYCVVITGDAANGKTSTAPHIVLHLNKNDGFEIVVAKEPSEILTFRRRFHKQVFIIDNFCGQFSANQNEIDNWAKHLEAVDEICRNSKDLRLIFTCRKQVYSSRQFSKVFRNLKKVECKLLSKSLCFSKKEKRILATSYIGENSMNRLDEDILKDFEIFLLYCQLRTNVSVINQVDFFKEPVRLLNTEIQNLCDTDEWAFFILVVFDNKLDKRLFHRKISKSQQEIIDDVCSDCGLLNHPTMLFISFRIQAMLDFFIEERYTYIRSKHDKIFEIICLFVAKNKNALRSVLKHGRSHFISQRIQFQSLNEECNEFTILVPPDMENVYFKRVIKDIEKGRFWEVFSGTQASFDRYRTLFINFLQKQEGVELLFTNRVMPVYVSAFMGYRDFVEFLLKPDLAIQPIDEGGMTPLHAASLMGHKSVVELILDKSSAHLTTNVLSNPLYLASSFGHANVVEILLSANADVNYTVTDGTTSLIAACKNRHVNVAELLLSNKACANQSKSDGTTSLLIASQEDHIDIVKLLLKNNADMNCSNLTGDTPLYVACELGHIAIVDILLKASENKFSCEDTGFTLLFVACKNGNTTVVETLASTHIEINRTNQSGITPLYIASQEGHSAVVEVLLEYNADANYANDGGYIPLYIASLQGHTSVSN
jgi:ankyrin repeat protein